jgi:type IV pilus assembly protein PilA
MKLHRKGKSGQAMTEYIIIVVVVALAALAIFAVFSDTLRAKMGGAVEELGGDSSAKDAALDRNSHEMLKDLDSNGFN